jgi:ferredoxin
MSSASQEIAYLRVEQGEEESLLVAPVGAVLRDTLLANGISPYTRVTETLNCGGHGLCATCGVRFLSEELSENGGPSEEEGAGENGSEGSDAPNPEHWHDELAARFGFPRLSCQIEISRDMHLRIPEKVVWGSRQSGNDGDG